jgi:hypothetical protein
MKYLLDFRFDFGIKSTLQLIAKLLHLEAIADKVRWTVPECRSMGVA